MIPAEKCGLSQTTQMQIISVFQNESKIEKAILYGSRAKSTFKNGSDIDLTLIGPRLSLTELLKIENNLDDLLLPYKIDLSLLHQVDSTQLIEHIDQFGLAFYERTSG